MPSINSLIKAIKNGETTKIDFYSIPEEERRNDNLMGTLISFLEEHNGFDTLNINGYDLIPEHRKRIAALILTKPNLRHLSLSSWEMDEAFLKLIIQRPLRSLGLYQCGPLASMSPIIAGSNTLEDFSVSFSSFSDIDIANIKRIKTLKKFYCSCNQFSVKSLMELIRSNQLEDLRFDEMSTNITADDIKAVQEILRENVRLTYLSVNYKNATNSGRIDFIHDKRPAAKRPKIKIYSIMDTSCPEIQTAIDNAFAMQSGKQLRLSLLELGYNPNTYVDIYYKRNEINPVLNCEIANEQHYIAIKIIEAFPELDPNMTDWEGKNALHIACKSYTADKVVLSLIQHHLHKLDLNARDNRGCTPLHYLCAYGKLELVKKLIQLGSKVDIKDRLGRTPLDYAKFSKTEVEQLLDSIAICPFRDTKARWSGKEFVLPNSYVDFIIPYSPSQMSHVCCLRNVQASFAYITSEGFKETYPNQKAQEQKSLGELAATLSGKSVIEECMENHAKVHTYLSTGNFSSRSSVEADVPTGTPPITPSYNSSKSSKLFCRALAVGTAAVIALKFLTAKR